MQKCKFIALIKLDSLKRKNNKTMVGRRFADIPDHRFVFIMLF